jgi:hypothetical protein
MLVVVLRMWHVPGLFLALCCFFAVFEIANGQTFRLKDQTDWWSINNGEFHRTDIRARNESIAPGTFEVAGVALGSDQFKRLAATLGKATVVERGDASTARRQICYVSAENPSKVYAIFEFGEDESVFYLFRDGADWNGRRFCVVTKHISMSSGTASGLRLGLTPSGVEAILGKADAASEDTLVYSREVKEKTTPAQFEELRKDYPEQLNDKTAHEKFDYYSIEIYIEARFGKSGLNYLAVSKSG